MSGVAGMTAFFIIFAPRIRNNSHPGYIKSNPGYFFYRCLMLNDCSDCTVPFRRRHIASLPSYPDGLPLLPAHFLSPPPPAPFRHRSQHAPSARRQHPSLVLRACCRRGRLAYCRRRSVAVRLLFVSHWPSSLRMRQLSRRRRSLRRRCLAIGARPLRYCLFSWLTEQWIWRTGWNRLPPAREGSDVSVLCRSFETDCNPASGSGQH